MFKLTRIAILSLFVLALTAVPASAQDGVGAGAGLFAELTSISSIGIGLSIIGAGLGIGLIGKGACDGMARQPENSGSIQTAMIIAAALIEGAALFGLIICGFVLG